MPAMRLDDFLLLPSSARQQTLLAEIRAQHSHHYERNAAYRRTVAARGVGSQVQPGDLALLLRPAALTFKSYADAIGPFPQGDPPAFLRWLNEQLSSPLPTDRWPMFRRRYATLEALLLDIERIYADLGLELVTSTGTSGRASIVVRDRATMDLAVGAFFAGIGDAWGIARGTALVFVMPAETRVAMARTARVGTRVLDWASDGAVDFTVPFAATPDQLRVRAGRTFRPGVAGLYERRLLHPFMAWANERLAGPRFTQLTLACLEERARAGRPVMLLGGLAQLHAIALSVMHRDGGRPLRLPDGSRVATGGGMKEQYPFTPAQIRADLRTAFGGVPVSDVYGMAEANWAAFQCESGNYHLPPWVGAVVTDDDDRIRDEPDALGLLAFFDPFGGGGLIPPFFQTADRVRLARGSSLLGASKFGNGAPSCSCGRPAPYIVGGVRRVDLLEEAGCAAQV